MNNFLSFRNRKSDTKLIVGLGNPGRGYANSLHNLGFMCVNHFARANGMWFDKKRGKARIGISKIADSEVVVAKPHTYMNQSGQAVKLLVGKFNISLDDLIVIHDELDLPLGKIRVRLGGSSAGHRGVESIIAELGSQEFLRVRVGIGRPIASAGSTEVTNVDMVSYLLSDFLPEEKQTLTQVIPMVSQAIRAILSEGLTVAMNKYN